MIKFFGNIYFRMMEALMWVTLIGSTVAFGVMGAQGEVGGNSFVGFLLGAITGALLGFVINLCMVPFLQLMEIRNDVKKFMSGKAKLTKDVADIRIAVKKLAGMEEVDKKGGGGETVGSGIAKARDGGEPMYFPEKEDTPSFEC